ncbi:hypothetical protein [Rhodobacter capsulatus]|uniref:hypothetical protein n=1 Tax=Rhodobacter capsulatus TaxID=1061 RepID=UPI0040262072
MFSGLMESLGFGGGAQTPPEPAQGGGIAASVVDTLAGRVPGYGTVWEFESGSPRPTYAALAVAAAVGLGLWLFGGRR